MEPHLVARIMAAVYSTKRIPVELQASREAMEQFASAFAKERRWRDWRRNTERSRGSGVSSRRAETDTVATGVRLVAATVGGTDGRWSIGERPATQHTAASIVDGLRRGHVLVSHLVCLLRVHVKAPFPSVSQHIEQPQIVWLQAPDPLCVVLAVRLIPSELRQQAVSQPVVTARHRSRSARVLPFRLRRQAIARQLKMVLLGLHSGSVLPLVVRLVAPLLLGNPLLLA